MVIKSKKAQGQIFLILMLGIVFFVLGLGLAPAIHDTTTESRSTAELNCSNSTISNQDKSVCTQIDMFNPLWIGIMFGLAGLAIGGIAIR